MGNVRTVISSELVNLDEVCMVVSSLLVSTFTVLLVQIGFRVRT